MSPTRRNIQFRPVTDASPTYSEIRAGVVARHKMSGDWVKIGGHSLNAGLSFPPENYDIWALASDFPKPAGGKYGEKFADLEKVLGIITEAKRDYYDVDPDELGRAIFYMKRWLKQNSNVR